MASTLADVPQASGRLPIVGHSLAMLRDPLTYIESLRTYGHLVRIDVGRTELLFALSIEALDDVLRNKAADFGQGRFMHRAEPLIPNSMLLVDGEEHIDRRRHAQQHLRRDAFRAVTERHVNLVQQHMSSWTDRQWIDVLEETLTIALRTVLHVTLGRQFPLVREIEFRRVFGKTLHLISRRVMIPTWADKLPLPVNRSFERGSNYLTTFITQEARRSLDEEQNSGIMKRIVQEYGEEKIGTAISDTIAMIMGGTETLASGISWVLYHLGKAPEIQSNVWAEIHETIGDRPPSFDDIDKMPLLAQVIRESLRLYSAPILARTCIRETVITGVRVPAGTSVFLSPYATSRNPQFFDRPTDFLPDRWSVDEKATRLAFIPFGAGRRKCPGEHLAMLELPLFVAAILQKWRLVLDPTVPVRPTFAVTVRPNQLRMVVRKR
ncbi:cytochrome P450 [Streptomyces sp. NPDC048484]|uniref:cytochrome P450 n=1 Tax=Streptomyces sp. NPDC048484 TaxID=3155146 RepID=UPI00344956B7